MSRTEGRKSECSERLWHTRLHWQSYGLEFWAGKNWLHSFVVVVVLHQGKKIYMLWHFPNVYLWRLQNICILCIWWTNRCLHWTFSHKSKVHEKKTFNWNLSVIRHSLLGIQLFVCTSILIEYKQACSTWFFFLQSLTDIHYKFWSSSMVNEHSQTSWLKTKTFPVVFRHLMLTLTHCLRTEMTPVSLHPSCKQ